MRNLGARNKHIQELISDGKIPMLALEAACARTMINGHINRQGILGKLNAQAMSESSETWHDNSFADNVRDTAARNTEQALQISRLLDASEIIGFPGATEGEVTIGSVALLRYANEESSEPTLIVGAIRQLPIQSLDVPPDTTVVTLQSPLGRVILGASVGDSVQFQVVGNRTLSVEVTDMWQLQG